MKLKALSSEMTLQKFRLGMRVETVGKEMTMFRLWVLLRLVQLRSN